ncbi:MAG TPA: L,D-transpeptidase [Microvirga sp.]|jgi:lipoprotein-anchoring transpeptidase ErfK/SrfK|nr:L,D-transpeptidase [Microvirga sp.]
MKWSMWFGAVLCLALPAGAAHAQALKPEAVKEAKASDKAGSRALAAKVQILLDRARFSPGVIDGRGGENVDNALEAFRKAHGLDGKGKGIDEATLAKLAEAAREASDPVLTEYTITDEDVKGPFAKEIPDGLEEQAKLDRLAYRDPVELLAERFHMDEDFLKELNPGKDFAKAGTAITVANVKAGGAEARARTVKRIEVDKAEKQLRAYGDDDKLIAVYPATIGSASRPAPSGTLEVKAVAKNPDYTYNPEYKFEGVKSDKPFKIKPGPNNPVGSTWIDLSKDGYGIHGTPEPAKIGKTASHGCVRLTNWDAEALAQMVKAGIKVEFLAKS